MEDGQENKESEVRREGEEGGEGEGEGEEVDVEDGEEEGRCSC